MKMEVRKIVLWITYFGSYMDISDDLRLRLFQKLPHQTNSWLVVYTQVQVLRQNCHQKNPTTTHPSPPQKNPKAGTKQWQSHFTIKCNQDQFYIILNEIHQLAYYAKWFFLNLSLSKSLFSRESSFKEMNAT